MQKAVNTNPEPTFIIGWLQKTLADVFSTRQTQLDNFVEPIAPTNFEGSYCKNKKQIKVVMLLEVNGENETDLRLSGQLQKADNGRMGMDWRKIEGHSLWLAAIQAKLSQPLITLS